MVEKAGLYETVGQPEQKYGVIATPGTPCSFADEYRCPTITRHEKPDVDEDNYRRTAEEVLRDERGKQCESEYRGEPVDRNTGFQFLAGLSVSLMGT